MHKHTNLCNVCDNKCSEAYRLFKSLLAKHSIHMLLTQSIGDNLKRFMKYNKLHSEGCLKCHDRKLDAWPC